MFWIGTNVAGKVFFTQESNNHWTGRRGRSAAPPDQGPHNRQELAEFDTRQQRDWFWTTFLLPGSQAINRRRLPASYTGSRQGPEPCCRPHEPAVRHSSGSGRRKQDETAPFSRKHACTGRVP